MVCKPAACSNTSGMVQHMGAGAAQGSYGWKGRGGARSVWSDFRSSTGVPCAAHETCHCQRQRVIPLPSRCTLHPPACANYLADQDTRTEEAAACICKCIYTFI
eukprot:362961-Chlamydomonas_euryale.AAC.3